MREGSVRSEGIVIRLASVSLSYQEYFQFRLLLCEEGGRGVRGEGGKKGKGEE